MKAKKKIWSIVLLALSLALTLGTKFIFHACGAKEDGGWMSCHWAQQTVIGAGVVLTVLAVLLLLQRGAKGRRVLSLAMVPVALYAMLLPGTIVSLCMMSDMRCRAFMRPAVLLFGALIIIAAVINIIFSKNEQQERAE